MIELCDCKIGTEVWYSPSRGGPRFQAVVASGPWMCGGTPVIRLTGLPAAYSEYTQRSPPRHHVPAASIYSVDLRTSATQ